MVVLSKCGYGKAAARIFLRIHSNSADALRVWRSKGRRMNKETDKEGTSVLGSGDMGLASSHVQVVYV